MAIVLKISKPTKNVLTATSLDDFYLDSNYPLLKVHSFGTFSFSVALGGTTITHNLGYKPYAIIFSQVVDYDYGLEETVIVSEYAQHDWAVLGASARWWGYSKIYDNSIRVEVGQQDAFSFDTVNGFYYIFKDEAQ